jgi:hypothetical protein
MINGSRHALERAGDPQAGSRQRCLGRTALQRRYDRWCPCAYLWPYARVQRGITMSTAVEEIAELERKRVNAFNDGNLDAWMAMDAKKAVYTASTMPFWIEGKEAIRAAYVGPKDHCRCFPEPGLSHQCGR